MHPSKNLHITTLWPSQTHWLMVVIHENHLKLPRQTAELTLRRRQPSFNYLYANNGFDRPSTKQQALSEEKLPSP